MSGFVTAKEIEEEQTTTVKAEVVENVEEPTIKINVEPPVSETGLTLAQNTEGQLADFEILNPTIPMKTKVELAVEIADCLSGVIRSQGLVMKGLNKKNKEAEYVLIDGWEILGTMLGIVPVSRIIEKITNKNGNTVGYKARAWLYRNPVINEAGDIVSGDLIATADASATKDGFQKETFSMMSMAQTRALSKSYRMALGWIMKMAKFETTPAEEMPKFKKE